MEYREFGKTGAKVSVLGFGCMRFPLEEGSKEPKNIDEKTSGEMILRAVEQGVNYLDTAYFYHDNESEPFLGRLFERTGIREKIYLATKLPLSLVKEEGDFDRFLNAQLERLKTDHIDFYLLHCVNRKEWEETIPQCKLLEQIKGAKKDGRIRHIGFSYHDDEELFRQIIDAFDEWEFCQIQMNYVDIENQATIRGLEYAASKGLGVIIMEPLLGGKLASPPENVKAALSPEKTPVEWALDFLWNRPEVSLVLSGMSSMQMVEDNVVYASRSAKGMLSKSELEMLEKARVEYIRNSLVPCTKCRYCMPCPFGLDIPGIYEDYNHTAGNGKFGALRSYEKKPIQADQCKACGKCTKVCPQQIDSAELMPKIHERFQEIRNEQKPG